MEEKFEKVEMVREKCNVSYEEARAALEACDYEVLEAVIDLERKVKAAQAEPVIEVEAHVVGEEPGSDVAREAKGFWAACKRAFKYSLDSMFVAERNGSTVLSVPLIVAILGVLVWGATLWLLLIGLFLGMRYRIEGPGEFATKASDVLGKAADAADSIKEGFGNSIA